jgi:sigma-B regulation protein RsbU (phosphoserine phosphatase)
VAGDINTRLVEDVGDSGRFVSLLLLEADPAAGVLHWVRAGHPPGLLFDPAADRLLALEGRGPALGVMDAPRFAPSQRPFLAGQVAILATDGVWEARDGAGRMFGRQTVHPLLRARCGEGAQAILEALFTELDRFRGEVPLEDDAALVVIKAVAPRRSAAV